jgi:hypothetical protein
VGGCDAHIFDVRLGHVLVLFGSMPVRTVQKQASNVALVAIGHLSQNGDGRQERQRLRATSTHN